MSDWWIYLCSDSYRHMPLNSLVLSNIALDSAGCRDYRKHPGVRCDSCFWISKHCMSGSWNMNKWYAPGHFGEDLHYFLLELQCACMSCAYCLLCTLHVTSCSSCFSVAVINTVSKSKLEVWRVYFILFFQVTVHQDVTLGRNSRQEPRGEVACYSIQL